MLMKKGLVHDLLHNFQNLGITSRIGNVTYEVEIDGRKILKHIDHLVKFHEPQIDLGK